MVAEPTYEELKQRVADLEDEVARCRKTEGYFREILDTSPDMIYRRSLKSGGFQYMNPSYQKLTGYSAKELQSLDRTAFLQLVHPEDIDVLIKTIQSGQHNDSPRTTRNVEFRFKRKDGVYIWLSENYTLFKDRAGNLDFTVGVSRDITEKKRADEAVKESENQFATFMDHIPGPVFIRDEQFKPVYANKYMRRMLGGFDDMIDRISPEAAAEISRTFAERAEKILKGELDSSGSTDHQLPDHHGTLRTYRSWRFPIIRQNKPPLLGGLALDITEQMLAEEALRESEERYRTLFENSRDAIVMCNTEGILFDVNQAFLDLLGYAEEEIIGITLAGLHVSLSQQPGFLEKMIHDGYVTDFQDKLYRKDGNIIDCLLSVTAVTSPDGTVQGYQGIIRDITERTRYEEELVTKEAQYRGIFNAVSDALIVTDVDGTIVAVNPQACELYGYTNDEITSLTVKDLIHPDYRPRYDSYRNDKPMPAGLQLLEAVHLRKDGTPVNVELRGTEFEYLGTRHLLGIIRDTTALKAAQREKASLEEQLQQAQKLEAIGTLAAGIAHDFNNLLMGIQGRVSLMFFNTNQVHPHYQHLQGIEQLVTRGADLTKQLLGFARGGKYEVKPTNLNQLIEESCTMFGRTKKEINIRVDLQEDIRTVDIDRGQFEQVLMNLYVNAWQAMPGGGDLSLQTTNVLLDADGALHHGVLPGRYVKILVSDTGVGMDEETRLRVFEPFFTTKERGRGTGLGLASAYGIIKNHDGCISVESTLNKGTTFSILLPASEEDAFCDPPVKEDLERGDETVLLVDDEETITEVAKDILTFLGYTVLTAANGKEAIATFKKNSDSIDLIIIDMIMPDMGGSEVYDRIKDIDSTIKMILLTGYSLEGQANEIMARGCNGFIQKPLRVQTFSQKIREVLDQ